MTFSSKLNSVIHLENTSSKVNEASFIRYAVFFIIGISLFLRLLGLSYNDLLAEEAYYWNYAQHLDWGYLDHPPMVALLIKLTTAIFGTTEFGVRISSLFCWLLTVFFSVKLTNLISRGAGLYTSMLLAILPFFFLHSLIITPDQPLVVCWSATLYCLYRSLILNEKPYWYFAGLWLGLGLLSKYTIILLAPATFLYICIVPSARLWLTRKEPYMGAFIAALLFMPVIYWNSTHDWVSFAFQSTRRLNSTYYFSFHHYLGLILFFLMPMGVLSLWALLRKKDAKEFHLQSTTKRFLQIFTLVPLIIFGLFSLTREIKFNWIGPGFLAIIPWLAIVIQREKKILAFNICKNWLITAYFLLIFYAAGMFIITLGTPEVIYYKLFRKFISWTDFTQQINTTATTLENKTGTVPIIAPLDRYNIGSELTFYQTKFFEQGKIKHIYPIIGRQIFGGDSLMYAYWAPKDTLHGKTLIAVSCDRNDFNNPIYKNNTLEKSSIETIWSHSQTQGTPVKSCYYQVVEAL